MNRKAQAGEWALHALPYIALAAAFLLSVGAYALYGGHNLDSDISSEMVLAQLLNDEGALITGSWYYSTELRVVSPVPVYQLGLLLFDSWHWARTFSVAVLLAGVAASLLYLARGAGMGEGAVYCAAAIILPLSEAYAFLFTYGGFYTVYFMMTCWIAGLVLRLRDGRRRVIRLTLLLGLSVWGGLAGVRMLMICGAPLFAVCIVELFLYARKCRALREAFHGPQARMMGGALVVLFGMAAGYLVNTKVLSAVCRFSGYEDLQLSSFGLGKLVEQFETLFPFFGYRTGAKLLSTQGIASLAAICLVFLLLGSVCVLLLGHMKLPPRERMVPLFAACAVLLGMLLNGVTDRSGSVYTTAYYIAGVLLMAASAFLLLERAKINGGAAQAVLALLALGFAMESGAQTAVLLLMLALLICGMAAGRVRTSAGGRVVPLLAACATAVGMLAAALLGGRASAFDAGYYLFGVLLMAASVFLLLEKAAFGPQALRTAAMLLVTLTFMLEGISYLSGSFRTREAPYEHAAQWLIDNGYTKGFATFWNANVLTEASDGAIEVYVYDGWEDKERSEWLQQTAHRNSLPEGRVFVYLSSDEVQGGAPCAREDRLAYSWEGGAIYAYDSALEVDELQRAQAGT